MLCSIVGAQPGYIAACTGVHQTLLHSTAIGTEVAFSLSPPERHYCPTQRAMRPGEVRWCGGQRRRCCSATAARLSKAPARCFHLPFMPLHVQSITHVSTIATVSLM